MTDDRFDETSVPETGSEETVKEETVKEAPAAEVIYDGSAAPEVVYGGSDPIPPKKEKKEKKKKSGAGIVLLVILLCVVCVLGSAAAGYLGVVYARGKYPPETKIETTVLYRSVSTAPENTEGEPSFADIAELVAPSVVEITTEETITSIFQYVSQGAGSGVIISEDGYILTCNHVISSSSGQGYVSSVNVRLTDGKTYPAEIVGSDADTDLAVVKIAADEPLTPAVFFNTETGSLRPGDGVIVVGNPLGKLGGSVSGGMISALERKITVEDTSMKLMQIDAAVNPGNSGGGLFNARGELIGIINAKYSDSGIEGLGFAIPISTLDTVVPQLIEYGFVRGKVIIGIVMRDITSANSAYYYYGRSAVGVYIDSVREGYNDDVLQRGDRIIAVAGKEISSYTDIKEILADASVGDIISFTISRQNGKNAEIITVDVKCFESIPEGKTLDFNN